MVVLLDDGFQIVGQIFVFMLSCCKRVHHF